MCDKVLKDVKVLLSQPSTFSDNKATYEVYVGGSCGKKAIGGVGIIVSSPDKKIKISKGYKHTNDFQMNLLSSLVGLAQTPKDSNVIIRSHSLFLIRGLMLLSNSWKEQNWDTPLAYVAENKELWKIVYTISRERNVKYEWVRENNSSLYMKKCSHMALSAINRLKGA